MNIAAFEEETKLKSTLGEEDEEDGKKNHKPSTTKWNFESKEHKTKEEKRKIMCTTTTIVDRVLGSVTDKANTIVEANERTVHQTKRRLRAVINRT